MNILDDLQWRGLFSDCTDLDGLRLRLQQGPLTVYCGFDPTADSLHAGNLVPLLALRRFQLAGHHPIALAGGATGLIGDPSGKTAERQLLNSEVLAANIASVKSQLARLLDFKTVSNPAKLLDNSSWFGSITFLNFLRDTGKFFTVNAMVAKESIRARMEDREAGISFTEFSYMLLQAYDFYHLNQTFGCELEIGGSDQWGNITAGMELCHKKARAKTFGLTFPLLTNADGTKFGKTVAGAIWLDPKKTSVYRFYQFWVQTDDRDVIRYLKFFTFLPQEQIETLSAQHSSKPEAREAHRTLARELTTLIHGDAAMRDAVRASEILFGGGLEGVTEAIFAEVVGEVPTKLLPSLTGEGMSLIDLSVAAGLSSSRGQARKDIEAGGIYLNNERQTDSARKITSGDLLFGRHLLMRKGKRNYVVLESGGG